MPALRWPAEGRKAAARRRILTASAKRFGPGERDNNFGSGLIDPLQALQLADPRTATTMPPRPLRQQ
jgi:hypothetical protein